MKNPNSPIEKLKKKIVKRWFAEDSPGTNPRFQLALFFKDFSIFFLLPLVTVFLYKSCEVAFSGPQKPLAYRSFDSAESNYEGSRSQIINFSGGQGSASPLAGISKRSPGSLVKVRLLNVVETYSNAPVHAQIIDAGLGRNMVGSTLIGDATSDSNFNRIEITFRYVRNQRTPGLAVPIAARALSLDGTLGIVGRKKEGFFARAALNSSTSAGQEAQGKIEGNDLKHIIAKALTSGLIQEFGSDSQVQKNRSQVLTLQPSAEFFVELTDYFPGNSR